MKVTINPAGNGKTLLSKIIDENGKTLFIGNIVECMGWVSKQKNDVELIMTLENGNTYQTYK